MSTIWGVFGEEVDLTRDMKDGKSGIGRKIRSMEREQTGLTVEHEMA